MAARSRRQFTRVIFAQGLTFLGRMSRTELGCRSSGKGKLPDRRSLPESGGTRKRNSVRAEKRGERKPRCGSCPIQPKGGWMWSAQQVSLCSRFPRSCAWCWRSLEDSGPGFYGFRVFGPGGRPFGAHKFRTVVEDADRHLRENPGQWQASAGVQTRGRPRVTRVGHWLRRLSVDELPQCLNVPNGKMSLVGPCSFPSYEAKRYRSSLG